MTSEGSAGNASQSLIDVASSGAIESVYSACWPELRCTIHHVKQTGFRRRKLSSVVRKAITSYYTDQEQKEIEKAAKQQNISKSSFVASAALKEARRLTR